MADPTPPDAATAPGAPTAPRAAAPGAGTDRPVDSAGTSWHGRNLGSTGFDTDTGGADPAVADALDRARTTPGPDAERDLLIAAATARWLVPVVAAPAGVVQTEHGTAESGADMAVALLVGAEGRRALPVFTSLTALTDWDAAARPVPVTGDRAATAAIQDGCQEIVVDPGESRPVVLRPSMVWALAQRRPWLPAHTDPFVHRAVDRVVADETDLAAAAVRPGDPGDPPGTTRVVLGLRDGLDREAVTALATRVGERLATDGELRARIDGLAFTVTRADEVATAAGLGPV